MFKPLAGAVTLSSTTCLARAETGHWTLLRVVGTLFVSEVCAGVRGERSAAFAYTNKETHQRLLSGSA